MGIFSTFTILENKFSYTIKESLGKQIPSKEVPLGTGEPQKEIKKMLEEENDKHRGPHLKTIQKVLRLE